MIQKILPDLNSAPKKTYLWTSHMMILVKKKNLILLPPSLPLFTPPGGCYPKNQGGWYPKNHSRIEFSTPKNLPLDTSHDDIGEKSKIPISPPPLPPSCVRPRGCNPKNYSRFEFSTLKNLPMDISHDIGEKIKIPPCVHPKGCNPKNSSRFELNSASQKTYLWTSHMMILVKK